MKKVLLLLLLLFSSCSKNQKIDLKKNHQKIEYAGIEVYVPQNSRIIAKNNNDISGSVSIISVKSKSFSVLQWTLNDADNFEDPEEIKELFQAFIPDLDGNTKAEPITINNQQGSKITLNSKKETYYVLIWQCVTGRVVMFFSNSIELIDLNIQKAKSPTKELNLNTQSSLPPFILPEGLFFTLSNSNTSYILDPDTSSYGFVMNMSHISVENLASDQIVMGFKNLLGVENFKVLPNEKTSFHKKEIDLKNSSGDMDGEQVFMKSFVWAPSKNKRFYLFTLSYDQESSKNFLSDLNSAEISDIKSISELYEQHVENIAAAKENTEKESSINFLKRLPPYKDRVEVLVENIGRIDGLSFDQSYELLNLIPDYRMTQYSNKIFNSLKVNQHDLANAVLSRLMYLNEEFNYNLVLNTLKENDLNEYDLTSFIDETTDADNDFSAFPPDLLTEFSKLKPKTSFYRLLYSVFQNETVPEKLNLAAKEIAKSILQRKLPALLEEQPGPDSSNYFTYIEVLNILNYSPKDLLQEYLPLLENSTERQAVFYEILIKSAMEIDIDPKLIKKAMEDNVNYYQLYLELKKSEKLSAFPPEALSVERLVKSQIESHCEIAESTWPLNSFKLTKSTDSSDGKIYEFSFSNNDTDFVVISGPVEDSVQNFSTDVFIRLFTVDQQTNKENIYKIFNEELKEYFSEE